MTTLAEQAIALHQSGQLAEAIALYEPLLGAEPHRHDLRHNLGLALLAHGDLRRGEVLLNEAWEQDPNNQATRQTPWQVVDILLRHGYREQARQWLQRAIAIDPGNAKLRDAWQLSELPGYLAPEVFDEAAGVTLLRHAPRESSNYLYAIDIVGTCNLRCPSCPVGNTTTVKRPKGTMSLALFQNIIEKILREAPTQKPDVWLYNWGEPLLHPQLEAIIGLLKQHGLRNMVSTNLNHDDGIERVARAAPDIIKISLSGFHPETYNASHTGGDIADVKRNMQRLRAALDEHNAKSQVWVGHHIYRHNYHEQDEVRAFSEALGFTWQPIQAFWQPLEKILELIRGDNLADPLLQQLLIHPVANARHVRANRNKMHDCELRFNQTAINVDGSVALCCSVYQPENMLGLSFLEHPHADIEAAKYRHSFCNTCRHAGIDYSISHLPDSIRPESA